MIGTAAIVAIVTAAGALILAVRGLRSHGLGMARTMQMALAWGVIIIVLFVILRFLGA